MIRAEPRSVERVLRVFLFILLLAFAPGLFAQATIHSINVTNVGPQAVSESLVTFTKVEENRAGLLYLNNKLTRVITSGRYGFWAV